MKIGLACRKALFFKGWYELHIKHKYTKCSGKDENIMQSNMQLRLWNILKYKVVGNQQQDCFINHCTIFNAFEVEQKLIRNIN